MKKLAIVAIAIIIIVGSVFALHESQMTRNIEGEVISIEDGVVTIDALGQAWGWTIEEGEHFTEGQKVVLDFYDKGIDDYTVWEIVSIKD